MAPVRTGLDTRTTTEATRVESGQTLLNQGPPGSGPSVFKSSIQFPLKRKGCKVVVNVLFFVRHLGTFVNASHNWCTVSPLPKS